MALRIDTKAFTSLHPALHLTKCCRRENSFILLIAVDSDSKFVPLSSSDLELRIRCFTIGRLVKGDW